MKMKIHFALLAVLTLSCTFSFAQHAESSNPYAIFGSNPYIVGSEKSVVENKVFVIENFADDSPVARIEHNPQTGQVKLFDKYNRYFRQYIGFISKEGEKIILVNFVKKDKWLKDENQSEPIIVLDGGNNFWQAVVNIDKGVLISVEINGEA